MTKAQPTVADIITFQDYNKKDMLRLAACLEEHFPHSIANAVVHEAEKQGLSHKEMHTEVEYIIAHGISTKVDNKKVIIGSKHFVFEDENVLYQMARSINIIIFQTNILTYLWQYQENYQLLFVLMTLYEKKLKM